MRSIRCKGGGIWRLERTLPESGVNGIASLPPISRNTPKIKPAMDAAALLASKYGVNGPSGTVTIVGLSEKRKKRGSEEDDRFAVSAGTGFFINDQGLIITNRHVVKGAKTLLVVMNGKQQASGEVVMIDEEQGLALIKLKVVKEKTPFVHLAKSDSPGDGAECTVMGYPLIDRLGAAIKIMRGIVSSGSANEEGRGHYHRCQGEPGEFRRADA